MSSSNTSGRPPGCITIPVQIISAPSSNSYSRHNSSFGPYRNENSYSDFSNSPLWEKPPVNPYSTGRFQPRQSPIPSYDRLIKNSKFNQPYKDRPLYHEPQYYHSKQRIYEPNPLHISRSSDDLLSPQMDSIRSNTQSQNPSFCSPIFNNGFRSDSDFIQPNENSNFVRRSYDALNDVPDTQTSFPINRPYPSEQQESYYRPSFVNSNEYRVPTNHQQPNATQHNSQDRSHSPASQCEESPTRPPPPPSQSQESDFKVTKETAGSIPKSGATATSLQSNDQQVPSTDISPVRDPNTIALEKLEQTKQNLSDLNLQVDAFNGSTRDDRAYKELDEQALKMMMRCDELIDVSADIKEKRKEMICNVQAVLAKLESKVPINPLNDQNSNQMETTLVAYDPSINNTESQEQEQTST